MSASFSAIQAYFKMPSIWLSGIIAVLGIFGIYFSLQLNQLLVTGGIMVITMLILPFFFAGTYGMILDGNQKKGSFLIYGKYGYLKCLTPALFITAICLLLYILFGMIGLMVALPIIFFTYLADITAMRHNLSAGQALKDSFSRVVNGSFFSLIFYFGNLVACILWGFLTKLLVQYLFPVMVSPENMNQLMQSVNLFLTNITQDVFLFDSINQTAFINLGNQFLSTPGFILTITIAISITSLIFVPFLVSYKAYFFRDLLVAQAAIEAVMKANGERIKQQNEKQAQDQDQKDTNAAHNMGENQTSDEIKSTDVSDKNVLYDPHAGEDGEYDSKGRWFKYK